MGGGLAFLALPLSFSTSDMLKRIVQGILRSNRQARDSDALLMYYVLQDMGQDPNHLSASRFLQMIHTNELPPFEAVSRMRRKLQEEDSSLRGLHYEARQTATKRWQKELGYN